MRLAVFLIGQVTVKRISFLIIIFLTPAIILLNFRLLLTDQRFYQKAFAASQVSRPIDRDIANYQLQNIIDYLCCGGRLDPNFLTPQEILHMQDVLALVSAAQVLLLLDLLLLAAIAALLIGKKQTKLLLRRFSAASLAGIVTIAALSISTFVDFDFLFVKFHELLFANQLWLLPAESNLIKLFPQKYFQDFANQMAIRSLLMLGITFTVTVLLKRLKSA